MYKQRTSPAIETPVSTVLTLNAPIVTKVVCFSRLLKCLRSIYRSSLFWVHAVCFFTYSSVKLGNYLQQTSADDIFRYIFFLGALRFNYLPTG